jgi:hypothetical protein
MLAECRIILPETYGDDSLEVPLSEFRQLECELVELAGGLTLEPGPTYGVWRSGAGKLVYDLSRVYLVAVAANMVATLRELVIRWGQRLRQEAVYLSSAGFAELVATGYAPLGAADPCEVPAAA